MNDHEGTPRTLREAIRLALCIGPLAETEMRLQASVRDFLAQRFGAAMLEHPDCELMLESLFRSCTDVRTDEGRSDAGSNINRP